MPSSTEPHGGWHVVLALCSDVRRCAAACIAAAGASDVHVRACVHAGCVGHTARWPVVALRLAGQERSPERCIVVAFARPPMDKRCARRQPVYISL